MGDQPPAETTGAALRRVAFGRNPRRTLWRAAALVLASVVIFGYVLLPVRGEGISMVPTFRPGRLSLVNTLAYRWHEPQRGDIVALQMAGRRVLYVKRIIGLPGERVAIVDGTVMINGQGLAEPYVTHRARWRLPEISLDADEYFLVGDNRGMPLAQHELGTARRPRIVGKLLF